MSGSKEEDSSAGVRVSEEDSSNNKTIDLVSDESGAQDGTIDLSSSSEEGPDEISSNDDDDEFVTGIASPGGKTTPEEQVTDPLSLVTSTPAAPLKPGFIPEEVFEGDGENEVDEEVLLEKLALKTSKDKEESTLKRDDSLDETVESRAPLLFGSSNGNKHNKRDMDELISSDRKADNSQNSFVLSESLLNASTKPNFDFSDLKARNADISSIQPSPKPKENESSFLNVGKDQVSTVSSPNKRLRKMEIDIESLPKTCTILKSDAIIVYLVGTAHFSKESHDDVAATIQAVQPDVIMMELCKSRTNIIFMEEEDILAEAQNMNMQKILDHLKSEGPVQGLMSILLLSLSAHLTKELGLAPGGEFRTAWKEARKIPGCLIYLGDRPINVTMQRALGALSFWQKIKLGFNILTSKESISKEDIEKCKQKDLLESLLEEMTGNFPALTHVLIEERDLFLARSLKAAGSNGILQHRRLPSKTRASAAPMTTGDPTIVVGVVGLGHVQGISNYWDKVTPEQVAEVMKIPLPTTSEIVVRKVVKFGIYSLAAYGIFTILRGPISRIVRH